MASRLSIPFMFLMLFASNCLADVDPVDRELCNQIGKKLRILLNRDKISSKELVIQVKNGAVTVTGQIENIRESRKILKSITSTDGVAIVHLNLGVGRNPSPSAGPRRYSVGGPRHVHCNGTTGSCQPTLGIRQLATLQSRRPES